MSTSLSPAATPTETVMDSPFIPKVGADILDRLQLAEVKVETTRGTCGGDLSDRCMRDFTASLSLYVSFADLDEDVLPDWFGQDNWAGVPGDQKRDLLAKVHPALAELANNMTPEDEGAMVELVAACGSILNPYRLRGSLFDALDSRSQAHMELYPALTTNGFYGGIDLKPSLHERVEAVGNIVLLTAVYSSPRWDEIAAGLESALLAMVLADLADGACAIITKVGKLPAATAEEKAHKAYLENYWGGASFQKWKQGIWYAAPAFRAFEDATLRAQLLLRPAPGLFEAAALGW